MCGIFGYLAKANKPKIPLAEIDALLAHRGPNGYGTYEDDNITLHHRRLSILDLSEAGSQPMRSDDGRYVLIHNGEIYNHLELRNKYSKNYKFKGHSDTETLIVLLSEYGDKIIPELVGMWAFAFWDKQTKQLLLSRDRFGQKPLFWIRHEDNFAFCSEVKPLLKLLPKTQANALAMVEYLATGNYGHLEERTFFEDVYKLQPATYVWLDTHSSHLHPKKYWNITYAPRKDRIAFDLSSIKQFRILVTEAVHSQLISDVPVGFTLSGGFDSSTIVSVVASNTQQKLPVFSAQTPNDPLKDETRYVKALMKKYEGKLEVDFSPIYTIQLSQQLEHAIYQQEEPFGDPSIIAHGYLIEAAKNKSVPVILGGQGGDEVLLGYTFMLLGILAEEVKSLNVRRFLRESKALKLPLSAQLRIILAGLLPDIENTLRQKARKGYRNWLSPKLLERVKNEVVALNSLSSPEGVLKEAIEKTAIPHLTHYDDISSMSRSIESRMPFLDHRILDFTSTLHTDAFLENGSRKGILREAFKDLLPTEILERKDKIGFNTAINLIILKEIDWINNILTDEFTQTSGVYNMTSIKEKISRFRANPEDTHLAIQLFRAVSVRIWLQKFNVHIHG